MFSQFPFFFSALLLFFGLFHQKCKKKKGTAPALVVKSGITQAVQTGKTPDAYNTHVLPLFLTRHVPWFLLTSRLLFWWGRGIPPGIDEPKLVGKNPPSTPLCETLLIFVGCVFFKVFFLWLRLDIKLLNVSVNVRGGRMLLGLFWDMLLSCRDEQKQWQLLLCAFTEFF